VLAYPARLDGSRIRRRYSAANVTLQPQQRASLVVAHFLTEWADG